MNHSEQLNELAAALAKAQGSFPEIPRNRNVAVTMKTGGRYSFKYATLDAILAAVRKPLSENLLALTCFIDKDEKGEICVTRMIHSSGQWIESFFPIIVGEKDDAQKWGSAMTYAKRNSLCALLSIHADEDDDGASGSGHTSVQNELPERTAPSYLPMQKPAASTTTPPEHRTWEDYTESEKIAYTEAKISKHKGFYTELKKISESMDQGKAFKGVSDENFSYLLAKLQAAMEDCETLQDRP